MVRQKEASEGEWRSIRGILARRLRILTARHCSRGVIKVGSLARGLRRLRVAGFKDVSSTFTENYLKFASLISIREEGLLSMLKPRPRWSYICLIRHCIREWTFLIWSTDSRLSIIIKLRNMYCLRVNRDLMIKLVVIFQTGLSQCIVTSVVWAKRRQ